MQAGMVTFCDASDFVSIKDTDGDWLFKFIVATGKVCLVFWRLLTGLLIYFFIFLNVFSLKWFFFVLVK
jgi:hypothetical protein